MKSLSAGNLTIPKKPKSDSRTTTKLSAIQSNGTHKVDQPSGANLKRPLEVDEAEASDSTFKKRKVVGPESNDDGVVDLDGDGENGAILIDDD